MRKKNVLIVIIILVLAALGISVWRFQNSNNSNVVNGDNNINLNENINNTENQNTNSPTYTQGSGEKIVGNIKFKNMKTEVTGENEYEFTVEIENLSDNNLEETNVEINALDSAGNVAEVFCGVIKALTPHERSTLKIEVYTDITAFENFEFIKVED